MMFALFIPVPLAGGLHASPERGTAFEMCATAPSQVFAEAEHARRSGHTSEAARLYFEGAARLRQGPTPDDPEGVGFRRVAYANGANLLLSLAEPEEARRNLLAAAEADTRLADDLRAAADGLPAPMRCTAP